MLIASVGTIGKNNMIITHSIIKQLWSEKQWFGK